MNVGSKMLVSGMECLYITDCKIERCVNEHGKADIYGYVEPADESKIKDNAKIISYLQLL